MATFAELVYRAKFNTDKTGYRMAVDVSKLLHESENEFIRRTFCTMTQRDVQIEASTTVEFDGTETDIAFVKGSGNTRDTITDASDGFTDDGFAANQQIVIAGSTSNDGTYTIYSVADGTITLTSIGQLTSEAGIADMTIKASEIPHLVALPDDFVKMFRAEYRGIVLEPLNIGSDAQITKSTGLIQTGTPYFYWIEGTNIQIVPKPTQEGLLRLWYCYYNTDSTTTSPIIPETEHYKLVNHSLGIIYEMDQKSDEADRYFAKFERDVQNARLTYAKRRHSQRKISDATGGEGKRRGIQNWIKIVSES